MVGAVGSGAGARTLPIQEYAAVGNGRGVALIGADGAIDWCCLPRIDSCFVFDRLLDARDGSYLALSTVEQADVRRGYVESSNVLETTVRSSKGVATVTDHMPRGIARIVRTATGVEGVVTLEACFRGGTARDTAPRDDGRSLVLGAGRARDIVVTAPVRWQRTGERTWRSDVSVRPGERLVWSAGLLPEAERPLDRRGSVESAIAEDRAWVEGARDVGEFSQAVRRSLLALRLLVQDRSGAIAAAATSSLPEEFGGVRNWDYRYCWLRDAALVLDALMRLGMHDEAMRFWGWLEDLARGGGDLRVVYAVDGAPCPEESHSERLAGYRDSLPVRIGNAARAQVQHDVRGYVLDAAWRCQESMREPHEDLRPILRRLTDEAASRWREPDRGLWEMRGAARHFVHSKVMSWVALDRALRLAERDWLEGDVGRWRWERDELHRTVLEKGFDARRGTFVQAFGDPALDAAALIIPIVGFLPAGDPRVLSTLDAVSRELGAADLLYRYRTDDGLPGTEGAFVACSFWRVEVLARAGRYAEAHELMERLVARTNDVGLLSEEIDARTGAFLGNFPQALSHLALVQAALALDEGNRRRE